MNAEDPLYPLLPGAGSPCQILRQLPPGPSLGESGPPAVLVSNILTLTPPRL